MLKVALVALFARPVGVLENGAYLLFTFLPSEMPSLVAAWLVVTLAANELEAGVIGSEAVVLVPEVFRERWFVGFSGWRCWCTPPVVRLAPLTLTTLAPPTV